MCNTIDKIIENINKHFDSKLFKAGYDEEGNLYFRINKTEIFLNKNGDIIRANCFGENTPVDQN